MVKRRPPRMKPSPESLLDLLLWHLKNTEPKHGGTTNTEQVSSNTKTVAEYPTETLPGIH